MVQHIILDTDIGGDPDDFFALLLALNSPEICVDLIVTSDEHKEHRKVFAEQILSLCKKKIPVLSGADLGNSRLCVIDELVTNGSPTPNYLDIVRQVILNNKITYYVCISPQTNLALLIEKYPEVKPKLEITIMGGSLSESLLGKAEHNVRYDIYSAQKVLSSGIRQWWITAEVTNNQKMKIDKESSIYKTLKSSKNPALNFLAQNCEIFWKKLYPLNFLHDPVALSSVFKTNLVRFSEKKININNNGIMYEDPNGNNIFVSKSVKIDEFVNFLCKRIFK